MEAYIERLIFESNNGVLFICPGCLADGVDKIGCSVASG